MRHYTEWGDVRSIAMRNRFQIKIMTIIVAMFFIFPVFIFAAGSDQKSEITAKIPLSELKPIEALRETIGFLNLDFKTLIGLGLGLDNFLHMGGQTSSLLKSSQEKSSSGENTSDSLSLTEFFQMLKSFSIAGLQIFVVILEMLLFIARSILRLAAP